MKDPIESISPKKVGQKGKKIKTTMQPTQKPLGNSVMSRYSSNHSGTFLKITTNSGSKKEPIKERLSTSTNMS